MVVSKFIFSRIGNTIYCYWNYALSRLGLVRSSHMPVFVSVEPSAVCQLRCPECPVGAGNKIALMTGRSADSRQKTENGVQNTEDRKQIGLPFMSMAVWERVLGEVKPWVHTVQFYFQGEPLLHSGLPVMVRATHEAGIYTVVSTNGQALTEGMAEALVRSGLNRIIVSMDGLSEASYHSYRVGGSFEKTKAALRYLRKAKERFGGHMVIELQCLRLRTNEDEWKEFRRVYRSLGADRLVFKTAQLYAYRDGHPLMPTDSRYSRYEQTEGGIYRRKALGRGCRRVWSGVVITTEGEVLPCCYDKERAYSYGNIMSAPLSELFHSERAQVFRKAALNEQPSICQECWR